VEEQSIDPLLLVFQTLKENGFEWAPLVYTLIELWAITLAFHAIRRARTSQGAIAWAVALITMPIITIPLYLSFGRSKFIGHVDFRRKSGKEVAPLFEEYKRGITQFITDKDTLTTGEKVLSELAHLPWLKGNSCKLLINGEETFNAIYSSCDQAKDYILHQYFIIEDNEEGERFAQNCISAAQRGVAVYVIYDAIGCYSIDDNYWDRLKKAGVQVAPFHIVEKRSRRFQINFRNHRKITIVDGSVAFIGGHNIGDSYVGKNPALSPWRDTHMQIHGPSVQSLQVCFLEDWYFSDPHCGPHNYKENLPQLNWQWGEPSGGDSNVLILPTGPSDDFESCGLMFANSIHQAKERLWLASPYFIPDGKIRAALILAALKGVDVRILLPERPDHKMVYYARQEFYEEMQKAGVKFYLYRDGFLHQKAFIVDQDLAAVGTANLDNRSFRLNFELTGLVKDPDFISRLADQFETDFTGSILLDPYKVADRPLFEQVLIRVCRLFSPIL
jgi:cardiolipin synthase